MSSMSANMQRFAEQQQQSINALYESADILGVTKKQLQLINLRALLPFANHPFYVLEGASLNSLVDSIKESGVLTPILVRPKRNGMYEIISGHRRTRAATLAGLTEIPAYVQQMTDEEAIIYMVDSNIYREDILPSEKAFAYKMKFEAMKKQGRRTDLASGQVVPRSEDVASGQDVPKSEDVASGQVVPKSSDSNRSMAEIGSAANESWKTVQRYISLTKLIPELLHYVDVGKIGLVPAVDLSKLSVKNQQAVAAAIQTLQLRTLKQKHATDILAASKINELSEDDCIDILYNPPADKQSNKPKNVIEVTLSVEIPQSIQAELQTVLIDYAITYLVNKGYM